MIELVASDDARRFERIIPHSCRPPGLEFLAMLLVAFLRAIRGVHVAIGIFARARHQVTSRSQGLFAAN
jgi:hypothetical protein